MKKIIVGALIIVAIFAIFKYCDLKKTENENLFRNTNLIQQQIENVGKLVVTEGHFSEVLTYKDKQNYLLDFFSFEKKALIVINADVSVSYNLREIQYDIDEKNKVITIKNIPKPEIKINPNIEFYDVNQSRLNPFTGDDYNKINAKVRVELAKKIDKSSLKSNAQNRLISELQKILILTNSMGWTLQYNNQKIDNESIDEVVL
ncbi:DUF4230 domain-containing protein [Flavobacterium sp. '19STA2R22 D10 B1']|uniref:DUF4230 domain-containing protein n=1 Tax=Flavobacterium aerium TaxID=3037261 RepID=UPI00278C5718|nr:DUF4230 domain-containing protein [Flavobacterium sp. '19STA2R22 D10 B1']